MVFDVFRFALFVLMRLRYAVLCRVVSWCEVVCAFGVLLCLLCAVLFWCVVVWCLCGVIRFVGIVLCCSVWYLSCIVAHCLVLVCCGA